MTGNGWLYKFTSTNLQASSTDWWWRCANSKRGEKDNSCKSVFHICKWWLLMSLRLFCHSEGAIWCQGSIHCFATWKCRLSVALFVFADVGSQKVHCARKCACAKYALRLFFSCHSILLDFWEQSSVHMVLATWEMAYVSVIVKLIGWDWEVRKTESDWVVTWQRKGRWESRDIEGVMPHWNITLWCGLNPGSYFKTANIVGWPRVKNWNCYHNKSAASLV